MNFRGAAKRRQDGDLIDALALVPGVEIAALQAIMDIESPESGFVDGRPSVLFERHIFWRELGDSPERKRAADQNLAYPRWHMLPYPKNTAGVYREIEAACAIDETAALRSTSWGLGQIMGSEHLEAGYQTPQAMVAAFCEGEREQIFGMVNLIKARHLDKALIDRDWVHFARSYNGTGEAQNQYHQRLEAAYHRRKNGWKPGPVWFGLQENLKVLKLYDGAIDGLMGPITRGAIQQFQKTHSLLADGSPSPDTLLAIEAAVVAMKSPTLPVQPPRPVQPAPPPVQALPLPPAPHVEAIAPGMVGGLFGRAFGLDAWQAIAVGAGIAALVYLGFYLVRRARRMRRTKNGEIING